MDPLQIQFNKFPFDKSNIKEVIVGSNYVAIMLNNGTIGLASCLQMNLDSGCLNNNPTPQSLYDRPFLLAYYNALFNYQQNYSKQSDVIEFGQFEKHEKVVMIGFFRPLYQRLIEQEVIPTVFDIHDDSPEVTPINTQEENLKVADKIILSATSIINNTFSNIIASTKKSPQIFIVGPSSNLHPNFYLSKKIKGVFGSCFPPFCEELMNVVKNGGGMRDFSKYAKKVRA